MSQSTILIGTGALAGELVKAIRAAPRGRYSLLGLVAESGSGFAAVNHFGCPLLGTVNDLHGIVARHSPRRIIVAVDRLDDHIIERLLAPLVYQGIAIEAGSVAYEKLSGKLPIEAMTPADVLFNKRQRPSAAALAAARVASLAIAVVATVLWLPLALLVALAIKLDSPGPVFFTQERVGLRGRKFRLLKFRSMLVAEVAISEWAGDNADRITAVGSWLRRYRLDETPQFLNVLCGHMNLVGPRPHPVSSSEIVSLIARNATESGHDIPYYSLRASVRPGITGWAQVRYQYATGFNEEVEKLKYDLYYVRHYSLWLDARILLETVKVVLSGGEQDPRRVNRDRPAESGTLPGEQEPAAAGGNLYVAASKSAGRDVAPGHGQGGVPGGALTDPKQNIRVIRGSER